MNAIFSEKETEQHENVAAGCVWFSRLYLSWYALSSYPFAPLPVSYVNDGLLKHTT